MKDIREEIIETISYLIKQNLSEASFNKLIDGKIIERTNDTYTVMIANEEYFNVQSLNHYEKYSEGDLVYIIVQNNNFSEKLILGRKAGSFFEPEVDKDNLPTEPVLIIRENDNPRGKAVRFDYGFEGYPIEKVWSQVLHRDSNGKVIMITSHYFNGTVDYTYLLRN